MAGEIDYQVFQDMLADPRLEAVKNEIVDNKYRDLPEEVLHWKTSQSLYLMVIKNVILQTSSARDH